MSNPVKKVKIKATGKIIEVYKHQNGNWVKWPDCQGEVETKDLEHRNQNGVLTPVFY